jgi:1,3-propanediol dehydrogenase/alcohol dehydrogenase
MIRKEDKEKSEHFYLMPTEISFGWGCRKLIDDSLLANQKKKVLLVTGQHFQQGELKPIKTSFKDNFAQYDQPIKKSDINAINRLASFCREQKPGLMVAVGGGTVLDTAKAAAIVAENGGQVEDYVVKKTKVIEIPGIPLVAVPTTAGTGTEVTPFAVVWDSENRKKYSLASLLMFPKRAVVDPELTINLPPQITAYTGMDALAQAIEAYWSKNHNPFSDVYALKAIKLAIDYLEKATCDPDQESREKMALSALMAGLAFSNTKTTICHAVSYPITAHWGVAHGQAVAITLPSFVRHSLPTLKQRERPLLKAFESNSAVQAAEKIEKLMTEVGLKTRLSQLGLKQEDLDLIVSKGFDPDRAVHAPWVPTPEELKSLLEVIL